MRNRVSRIFVVATVVLTGVPLINACGAGGGEGSGAESFSSAGPIGGKVAIFATASLTESFTTMGKKFEASHPGVKVTFNFANSSTLATQINAGAPADVFVAASVATMAMVVDANNVEGSASTFVKNQLVIAVRKGNPKNIAGLSDLVKPGLKVALCAEQVPCGAATKKVLASTKVAVKPVTWERDAKATLAKVTLGEVDAALVNRTDVLAAADQVSGVEFPESSSAINDYSIAVVRNSANRVGARAFVEYVCSQDGVAILIAAGFQRP